MRRFVRRLRALCAALLVGVWTCGVCLGEEAVPTGAGSPPGTSAKAHILIEASTGRVIAAKNERERLPIASTTKILTALLALEEPDVEDVFTVDSAAIRVEGTSMGLKEGDQVSLLALAHGMLLCSGNDAANAAAVRISGSLSAFAQRMNEKAASLGMTDSHFVTPSGLHDEDHYSTAADMAQLARYALLNERFFDICSKQSAKVVFGNPPFGRWLKNHNRLLSEYPGCVGVKTGFTKKAGRCLVSAAERDGVRLICVTLGDPDDWRDHTALLDYGFSVVKPAPFSVDVGDVRLKIAGGVQPEVAVEPFGQASAWLSEEQLAGLEKEILLAPFCYAPVEKGDVVGQVVCRYEGFEIARLPLVAGESVSAAPPPKPSLFSRIADWVGKALELR